MDFAEAMKELEKTNPELYKDVQAGVTKANEEAKSYRQKNSTNNEVLASLLTQLGVEDVKKVPEVVTTKNDELNAIIEQRKEDRKLIDDLLKESEENKRLLSKGSMKEELKAKFKGFKDPEYMAELYVDKAKKGETGLLIGDKFVDDVIKGLGAEKPYLLSKEIAPEVTTDTKGEVVPPQSNGPFTEEQINNMSDEELDKNLDAILAQKEEV